jgi:homoserine kinase
MTRSTSRRAVATAFAPASVGNAAIGFDILGFAFPVLGDRVTVRRSERRSDAVTVERIDGDSDGIPLDPERNTAAAALAALLGSSPEKIGFTIRLEKGIPLASGLGGSAASAVAAVVAANALLASPVPRETLCACAAAGEAVASGVAHADNVAPSLYGGLTLVLAQDPPRVHPLPVPPSIHCALVHPHLRVETREARRLLRPDVPLSTHVAQSANLAAFIAGCHTGDTDLIRRGLVDLVIEPQRARLIPGFDDVRRAALESGALGGSISGAGPSVFAWCAAADEAERVRVAMERAFGGAGVESDGWIAPVGGTGAVVVEDV